MTNPSVGPSIKVWGWTLGAFLLVSYFLCIGFGLVAPERFHMLEAGTPFLPGFEWLTPGGFLAGAIGSFLYGWYIALIAIPLYRYFSKRVA